MDFKHLIRLTKTNINFDFRGDDSFRASVKVINNLQKANKYCLRLQHAHG